MDRLTRLCRRRVDLKLLNIDIRQKKKEYQEIGDKDAYNYEAEGSYENDDNDNTSITAVIM